MRIDEPRNEYTAGQLDPMNRARSGERLLSDRDDLPVSDAYRRRERRNRVEIDLPDANPQDQIFVHIQILTQIRRKRDADSRCALGDLGHSPSGDPLPPSG